MTFNHANLIKMVAASSQDAYIKILELKEQFARIPPSFIEANKLSVFS